ncbi:hypothetical protein ACROYT_G036899 [Oculina patagonica]
MQSTSKNTWIPHCREYCDGNVAEFYCPECAAMFCSSCYDREHCGNERKSQHGKLTELRAICSVHKHTLDYFNLTLLQPMCVICKKETMLAPEHEHHVIDHIEATVPKLRSLMEKNLESASESIDRLTRELARVENAARNTLSASVNYIQCCFAKLRQLLDEREVELLKNTKNYFDEFIESGEGRVETRNALRKLKALSEEGKLLLMKDGRSLVVEFPSVFMRLKELCGSLAGERQMKKLKMVIDFEKSFIEQLRQAGTMKSYSVDLTTESSPVTKNKDRSCTSQPDCKRGIKRHFSDPPSSPQEEPSSKQAKTNDTPQSRVLHVINFTDECNKSPRTPLKATSMTSAKIASPSPRKLCKPTARKTALSPQWTPSSPIETPSVASPRRKRGGELSKEFMKCDAILTEIWAQDESFPFARPVNKRESPDYYKVIKKPMDLSIIKEKLHTLQYASAVDFVKDMRLLLSNCKAYNKPGSYVFSAGEELENVFNRLLKENFPNFEDVLLENCEDGSPPTK